MKIEDLNTSQTNTWCPGCYNNMILQAVKQAIVNLVNEDKISLKDIVAVTGIGCADKIYDYINVNGFCSVHGRVPPTMLGIKSGNPELTVLGFSGDGGTYDEGVSHLIKMARYNPNAVLTVHNNQVFSLTTGQPTPTTEKGFKGPSMPLGTKEKPLNPLTLMLSSGASFVARGSALDIEHLTSLFEKAITHKGFAFIDVIQPCLIFHNKIKYFQEHSYKLDDNHDETDLEAAFEKARQWDLNFDEEKEVPIGVFYQKEEEVWSDKWPQLEKPWYQKKRKPKTKEIIESLK